MNIFPLYRGHRRHAYRMGRRGYEPMRTQGIRQNRESRNLPRGGSLRQFSLFQHIGMDGEE